ncbi:MAG: T9SS type A sorting domain-containing protein [Saprospiraceae bacterium]
MSEYSFRTPTFLFLLLPYLLSGQPAPLDTSFGIGGIVNFQYGFSSLLQAVKLLPDGKILISGVTNSGIYLARFNPDGSLDNTFGTGGVSPTLIENVSPHTALAIQSDNKIISVGQVIDVASPFQYRVFGVMRFHPDGTLDPTFGQSGVTTARIGNYAAPNIVTLQPDGKILVLGQANIGTGLRFAWARFYPDGKIDSTFSDNGITTFPTPGSGLPTCISILPDGKILTGGTEVGSDPGAKFLICRLLPNGVVDSTFGVNGKFDYWFGGYFEVISDFEVLPNGQILAGGWVGPTADGSFALLRLNANGGLDPSFGNNGLVTMNASEVSNISALDLLPNGKIVATGVGYNSSVAGDVAYVMRLHPDGSFDNSFNGIGLGTVSTGDAAGGDAQIIQPDGKILIGGFYYPMGGEQPQIMLARVLNEESSATSAPTLIRQCSISPNPFEGWVTLRYELEQAVPIGIKIYDMLGRCVQTVSEPTLRPAGEQIHRFDLTLLGSGIYRIAIESPQGTTSVSISRSR